MNNTGTPYKVLFDAVLSKIKDYSLGNLGEDGIYNVLSELIRPAAVKFYSCRRNLSDRDDLLQQFNFELNDTEIEILASLMALEYVDSNYIRLQSALQIAIGSKDFHSSRVPDQLGRLKEIQEVFTKEVEQKISIYSLRRSRVFI